MSEITVSEQHKQAVELHQKIIVSANLAQQNIWDMCTGLKQMRDDKLYKELGYANFEDYCENEVGMKRRNAYNYISIVENINSENVQSIAQIGMTILDCNTRWWRSVYVCADRDDFEEEAKDLIWDILKEKLGREPTNDEMEAVWKEVEKAHEPYWKKCIAIRADK